VTFDPRPFPFTADVLSPFNSQNTFFTRHALAHYFVLPGVGRMDDIWASYHLQSLGFRVAYGAPSVRQNRNAHALGTRGITHEIVFVEWNPVPDRPLLSDTLRAAIAGVRCVVVDRAVHRFVSRNRRIAVFEYHAKNVGARYARGAWLLLTNPDNYFGGDVLDFLAHGARDPDTLYRAGRADVGRVDEVDAAGVTDAYPNDPPPFIASSGDFAFCSAALFARLGGYREDLAFTNTHKDSIFCHAVDDLTGKVRKIGTTFHLRHTKDDAARRRLEYAWRQVDRSPQTTFGLDGCCVADAAAPNVTHLRLRADLAERARTRSVPRGRVPPPYRIPTMRRFKRHPLVQTLVRRVSILSR
jgi:hypothetical protein